MDPRSDRSRALLREALLQLIKEKPYSEIQIKDITEYANTGRVTFYKLYANKEELLYDFVRHVYEMFKPFTETKPAGEILDFNTEPPVLLLFQFVESDRLLFKRLLTCPAAPQLLTWMREFLVTVVRKTTGFMTELEAQHIASCVIGNLMWWLTEDVPHSAIYMARLTHWLSVSGIMAMRGELDQIAMPNPDLRAGTPFANVKLPDG
jgi:AcrR family transcriptional regulator